MNGTSLYIAEAASEYLVEPMRSQLLDEILILKTVEDANEKLHRLSGIRDFFPDHTAFGEFRQVLSRPPLDMAQDTQREWGDFQTPSSLASRVCRRLVRIGTSPRIIIEPTYGAGNFILAALESFPAAELIYGVEIQDKYEWHLKMALLKQALQGRRPMTDVELHRDDIFTHAFPQTVAKADDILIIGNPPWITTAELGAREARNLPQKSNLKHLSGLDAITGKSNFDLGEFIVLRLLELFSGQRGTLAVLCKNSVIKNVVEALPRFGFQVGNIHAYGIDTQREFGAAVEASLLVAEMGAQAPSSLCNVATLEHPDQVVRIFGWTKNRFVSNVHAYEQASAIDGKSPLVWRQGIKHDCAKIMELDGSGDILINGSGDVVMVEESWLYWLLKSSDLKQFEVDRARKRIIVTQQHTGDDTSRIEVDAPKLWRYLVNNDEYFVKRKSSIYRNRPRFSIFGVGDYSFKPYKVAISGLYKQPRFALVLPIDGRPMMLDDTCYFLGLNTYEDGLFTATVLNSPLVEQFLRSITFTDAKRPYTKEVLMRIDLGEAARRLSFDALREYWTNIGYEPKIPVSESDFEEYMRRLSNIHAQQESLQLNLGV